MNKVNLSELANGTVQEQFDVAFRRVAENLQNPNTPYKDKRSVTIKLTFTQNELRDDVKCEAKVTEKLSPQTPMETSFYIGKDLSSGELYAEEYGKQLRGQVEMDTVVDPSTGEVLEDKSAFNVVDLRSAVAK